MNMENVNLIIEWYRGHCPNNGVYVTVNQKPYRPLVIELQDDELWVGYWWEQNGDQVPDTLVVINLKEQTGRVETMFWSGHDDVYIHHVLAEIYCRLPEPKLRIAGKRIFSTSEVEVIKKYFANRPKKEAHAK